MVLFEGAAGLAMGAAIAVGIGALATAMAQSAIGTSAMGVIAEKPESAGSLLVWLVIPETIVIFAFVIAIMLVLEVPNFVAAVAH